MTFKIKDGIRISTVDVFNNTGQLLVGAPSAAEWTNARTVTFSGGDVTGSFSIDGSADVSGVALTIEPNSIDLGTDTSGNYVASITNGSYITGGNGGSEGATLTLAVDATTANTASKVVARDASGNFAAGTITAALSGNASTASAWATGRTITLTGDVTGTSGAWDGSGNISFSTSIAANSVALGTDTTGNYVESVAITANTGLSISGTAGEGSTFTLAGVDATTTTKGVASFSSASFDVTTGAVTIKNAGVSNTQLANSSITVGSTAISLGNTSTTLAGLTQVDVNNIRITGNTISSQNTNGNIVLDPNGTGTVDVNGSRITGVSTPTQATDAVNKEYVDAFAEGLHVHASVAAATTASLASLTGGSVTYSNGTNGIGATLTLGTALTTLDSYSLQNGDRIIVKNESTQAHNGIYTWATGGTVLTRADDFNTAVEMAGGDFVFITNGTNYDNTGWVQTEVVNTVGTDAVIFVQFSGAGTYIAGSGLSLTGNTFDVNVAGTGGIEIASDALQLKSSVAGNGLTLTSGVLDVVGTADRITASANSIDIASTYIGQNTITTLGTVATGTWSADTIAVNKGGTGQTSYTDGQLLIGNTSTGGLSKATLTAGANITITNGNGTIQISAGSSAYSSSSDSSTTVSTTTITTVDTFPIATYRSGRYLIQITQGSTYQMSELRIVHDGTTTYITEYSVLETSGPLATFTADISGSDARIRVTMGSATSATIRINRLLMNV